MSDLLCLPGVYDDARDTPNSAPCPIINIKKEKRETDEETKEILRKLDRDDVSVRGLRISLASRAALMMLKKEKHFHGALFNMVLLKKVVLGPVPSISHYNSKIC